MKQSKYLNSCTEHHNKEIDDYATFLPAVYVSYLQRTVLSKTSNFCTMEGRNFNHVYE